MADDKVVLLSFWASSFGLRVQIALAEKGIDYEYKEQDLFHKTSLLLESNPIHKKVPVLIHNGKPVCESLVIVQYIDEVWSNGPSLLPRDPYRRADARFWADYIDKKIYETSSRVRNREGEEQAKAKDELVGHLKLLERELGEKPYFGGDAFGFVDIALVPFTCWFHTYETFADFSIERECPKLMTWVERCLKRNSVAKPRRCCQILSRSMSLLVN